MDITLCRAYMNKESATAYFHLFTTVFNAIPRLLAKPIQWYHIHNTGFVGIVVDMYSKQASGMSFLLDLYY